MKLKNCNKINKAVSAQLSPFGISKAILSNEYSYDFEDESITYKLTENEFEDKLFVDFIKERFGYKSKYHFIISLLHEVGHHKANDEIEGAIYEFCIAEKERISNAINNSDNPKEIKKLEYQYFNLPDEIMATQWAVNWARKHPKKIEKMWAKLTKALLEFYEDNGLFDDETD